LAKAGQIGADAIIVDLEDSVPSAVKPAARETLAAAIATLRQAGAVVAVRINAPWREALADLDAAVIIGLEAIVVPKAEHAEYLAVIGEMIGEFEAARGLPARAIGVVALVESPAGLANAAALATAPRIVGLALGSEDFALSLGVPPSPAVLALPVQQIALAAAAAGVMALAVPISIALFRAEDACRGAAEAARAVGASGALCIHPHQVAIANAAFGASPAEMLQARAILDAWEQASGTQPGVIVHNGQMIDLPVVERARQILRQAAHP
jgi:citrate lyase subunit beta/citryl-CoA lyase